MLSKLFSIDDARLNHRQAASLSLLLLLLTAILYLPLLDQPPFTNEEPRRALVAQSIIASGDYWVPIVRDEIYTAKPPLYNWLIVVANQPDKAIDTYRTRLISLVSLVLLTVSMVFGFRRHLPAHGLVFLGLAIALAPELASKALIAEIDAIFTLLVTLSIWAWFWLDTRGKRGLGLWLAPALLVGLAFLTKREPALVFYYLSIGGYLLFQRRLRELLLWPHLLSALVMLAMIGFWLWKMIDAVGLEAFVASTLEEVVTRGTGGGLTDFLSHFLLYPLHILAAMLPFSLLLLPLVNRPVREGLMQRYPEIFRFAVIAVLFNLPPYLFRDGLSVRYFMPMMPTMLVIAALVYDFLVTDSSALAQTWRKVITRVVGILSLVLAFCVNLLLFPEQLGLAEKPVDLLPVPLVYLLSAAALIMALMLLKVSWQQSRRYLMISLVCMMLVLRVLYLDILLPHRTAKLKLGEDFPGLAATILETVPPGSLPVRTYGPVPNPLWFHMGYGNLVTAPKAAAAGLGAPGYIVGYRWVLEQLRADGMQTDELAHIIFEDQDLVFARVRRD
ncbi:MAG: glycosyltransferase family 39 protein [Gammaproteobacteria bacterium]|nr:glycosyltransferase family 39 protein [Gammaproteobacteria bacterium]